jgi:hypothetical protein
MSVERIDSNKEAESQPINLVEKSVRLDVIIKISHRLKNRNW